MIPRNRIYIIVPISTDSGELSTFDLKAYTTVKARARAYIQQYQGLIQFKVYEFESDNIFEVSEDVFKVTGIAIEKDDDIIVLFTRYNQPVYTTVAQIEMNFEDGGYGWSDVILQLLLVSLNNLHRVAKYVKEPKFKSLIEFIYRKYYIRIYLGITMDATEIKSDIKYKLNIVDDRGCQYSVSEFIDDAMILRMFLMGEGY